MLLETKQLQIQQAECCYKALKVFEQGKADFSDALIASLSATAGCSQTMTFDKDARSVGMTLLAIN